MTIAVVFSTLSGNTALVAQSVHGHLVSLGYDAQLLDAMACTPADLSAYQMVFFGSSTYGEGEQSPITELFMSQLTDSVSFSSTKFAFFSLGDSSYENFCTSGKLCQKQFEEYGATTVGTLHEIDGYPDDLTLTDCGEWAEAILKQL